LSIEAALQSQLSETAVETEVLTPEVVKETTVTVIESSGKVEDNSQASLVQEIIAVLTPQISAAVEAATSSTEAIKAETIEVTQSGSSVSDLTQQLLVALTPQIKLSIEAALQSQLSETAVETEVLTPEVVKETTVTVIESSGKVEDNSQASLVQEIIAVLTPQISAAVAAATSSTEAIKTESIEVTQSGNSVSDLTQQLLVALTPQIKLSIEAALQSQSSTASSQPIQTSFTEVVQTSSVVSESDQLIQQIIAKLTPQISAAVGAATTQVKVDLPGNPLPTIGNVAGVSSSSSPSLSSVFGSGGDAFQVKIETPTWQTTYGR